jgi:hypothetical protein
MDTTLTISRDGQQYGPYTLEQATGYLAAGTLLPTDLAWNPAANAWVPLAQIPGIHGSAAPSLPPPPPPAPGAKGERNIVVLILMGIVWFFVMVFVPLVVLGMIAGMVAGVMHPDDPSTAGRNAGQMIGSILGIPHHARRARPLHLADDHRQAPRHAEISHSRARTSR